MTFRIRSILAALGLVLSSRSLAATTVPTTYTAAIQANRISHDGWSLELGHTSGDGVMPLLVDSTGRVIISTTGAPASATTYDAMLAALRASATGTTQSSLDLDAILPAVRATATGTTSSAISLAALVAHSATQSQASLAAVQACATSLEASRLVCLTTGTAATLGAVRENAAGTVYAACVYPMGSYLATVDSATLLCGTGAIAVCSYVAPTYTSHLVMRNNSDTVTVYLGSSGVTAATGVPLYPHEAFTQDATTNAPNLWYAITASGSAELRWARW